MTLRHLREGIEALAIVAAAFLAFMTAIHFMLLGADAAWQWLFSTFQSLRA
jgi:translation initiation factor 2B subunit (eIF-2B alpha/beta/delta family)